MTEEYEIKPAGKFSLKLPELWRARELLFFFCWRDIKVKYKQTYLGIAWVVLQPLFMMVIYTVLFSKVLNADSNDIPYPVFVYSGLLLWGLFANSLSSSGDSMVSNAGIIKKIYFPRLIIPISSTLTCVFDFLISLCMYFMLLVFFQPKGNYVLYAITLPLSFIITLLTSLGLGTLLSALNVKYRDFRYILPFMIQSLFFVTPIVYSTKEAAAKLGFYHIIKTLNPMSTAVELMRVPLSGDPINFVQVAIALLVAGAMFVVGVYTFRKTEAHFADLA